MIKSVEVLHIVFIIFYITIDHHSFSFFVLCGHVVAEVVSWDVLMR